MQPPASAHPSCRCWSLWTEQQQRDHGGDDEEREYKPRHLEHPSHVLTVKGSSADRQFCRGLPEPGEAIDVLADEISVTIVAAGFFNQVPPDPSQCDAVSIGGGVR